MAIAERFQLVWTPFLKRKGAQTLQAVGLVCPSILGSGGELTLFAGARKYTAHTLDLIRYPNEDRDQHLPARYLWLIPRPARPLRVRATWKTPLGTTYQDAITLRPAEQTTVHVIFKTHLDLGYTHRLEEVIRLYQTSFMEKLLENLDRTAENPPGRRFVWTLSTWLLEQCLDPKAVKPEHLKRLEKYIREGSVVWGLMPFTTHSEFFGLEEMCRSIYAARRLAERFKRPVPRAAKMSDVPAHTASLAMAFRAAGGTFFQIGTNPESIPPDVPPLFWWKLPDGQRMLTHYHGTYGTPLLPPEDWKYRAWLSIQMTSDNVGPQSLATIERMEWIEQHFDWPVCRTGSLEDFADEVTRLHGRDLPVVEREFTDWWIHGIASDAKHTAIARETKERLPSLETIGTLAAWAAGQPVSNELRRDTLEAYQQLALYTEHTWGDHATDARAVVPKGSLYTSPVLAAERNPTPLDRWVGSWEDKAAFARQAGAAAERVEERALTSFARHLGGAGDELGIALFNSVSWSRGGPVRMSDTGLPAGEFELVDGSTGAVVPYERENGTLEFVAPPVPACGYLLLHVRRVPRRSRPGLHAEWEERNLTLHTSDTTLQFHTAGGMSRWHDRARSNQWCSGDADFPFGTYLYEMPGGDKLMKFARQVHSNTHEVTPGYFHRRDYTDMSQFGPVAGDPATIRPCVTPLCTRVVVEANCPVRKVPGRRSGDAHRYRTTFTMYRGLRDLHVTIELLDKRPTYAAEAGYGFFPFATDQWMLINRIAHQVQPHEELAGRVNAGHMAVGRGVRLEGTHAGVNFYPLHTPLLAFDAPGAYHFSDDGDYASGIVYATLFNNCWGTNFRQWQSGHLRYDFVCRPTGNDAWDGGLARGGAEVFRPLVASLVRGPRGDAARSLLSITPPDVQLVTLKPAEFQDGTVLRLWNSSADPVTATIDLPGRRSAESLVLCDLLERPSGRPLGRGGTFRLPMRPHEIATLLLARVAKS